MKGSSGKVPLAFIQMRLEPSPVLSPKSAIPPVERWSMARSAESHLRASLGILSPACAARSSQVGSVSGSGASGMSSECSKPSSNLWKDTEALKIALPRCCATTRRVVNDDPSRMRSTVKTIGTSGSPGRRKYA